MSYNEILQIVTAVCPTLSAIFTLLIGFASLVKTIKSIKSDNDSTKKETADALDKFNKKLSKMQSKLTSIEQALIEKEGK